MIVDREKRINYFTRLAQRVQPIFEQYGWKLGSKVPTVEMIVDFLMINAAFVDETGEPFESGRFLIRKDNSGIKNIDVNVTVDLTDSDWEF